MLFRKMIYYLVSNGLIFTECCEQEFSPGGIALHARTSQVGGEKDNFSSNLIQTASFFQPLIKSRQMTQNYLALIRRSVFQYCMPTSQRATVATAATVGRGRSLAFWPLFMFGQCFKSILYFHILNATKNTSSTYIFM